MKKGMIRKIPSTEYKSEVLDKFIQICKESIRVATEFKKTNDYLNVLDLVRCVAALELVIDSLCYGFKDVKFRGAIDGTMYATMEGKYSLDDLFREG